MVFKTSLENKCQVINMVKNFLIISKFNKFKDGKWFICYEIQSISF